MSNHYLTALVLPYPPVTNREADYVKEEDDVQAVLKDARLYAVAQHRELVFRDLHIDEEEYVIRFAIGSVDNEAPLRGEFDLKLWRGFENLSDPTLDIGNLAPDRPASGIKVWDGENNDKFFLYVSPLRLLFWRSRGYSAVSGLEDYRKLLTFDLHYWGRSVEPVHRLLLAGHEKRVEILSREYPMVSGASISDEIVVMFFSAETLLTAELEQGVPAGVMPSYDAVMRDAEKAFIHVLKPKFNRELYANYPKGSDGLYGSALAGYGYIVGDDVTLRTTSATISGDRNWRTNASADAFATMLNIRGDRVDVVSPRQQQALPEAGKT